MPSVKKKKKRHALAKYSCEIFAVGEGACLCLFAKADCNIFRNFAILLSTAVIKDEIL